MARRDYVPHASDVVWLEFRPVMSRPVTARIKGHPFEVLTMVDGIECAVLSDQIKSLDWKVRRARKKAAESADVMIHVRAKVKALLMIG